MLPLQVAGKWKRQEEKKELLRKFEDESQRMHILLWTHFDLYVRFVVLSIWSLHKRDIGPTRIRIGGSLNANLIAQRLQWRYELYRTKKHAKQSFDARTEETLHQSYFMRYCSVNYHLRKTTWRQKESIPGRERATFCYLFFECDACLSDDRRIGKYENSFRPLVTIRVRKLAFLWKQVFIGIKSCRVNFSWVLTYSHFYY